MNNELKGVLEDNSFNVIVQITETGPRGPQGPPGIDGKSLEFHWDGTKLGVRVEGDSEYTYVDLKDETGNIENLTVQHIINALGYTPANATNEHTHTNKSVIDKFSEVEGKPYYNGEEIGGAVPNLTLNELILGGRFKIVYNDIEDSLDIEVV